MNNMMSLTTCIAEDAAGQREREKHEGSLCVGRTLHLTGYLRSAKPFQLNPRRNV